MAAALAPLQKQGTKVLPYLDGWLICAPSQCQVARDTATLAISEPVDLGISPPGHRTGGLHTGGTEPGRRFLIEWRLHPEVVEKIWGLFGKGEVDFFASEESTHCPLWFSWTEVTAPSDRMP